MMNADGDEELTVYTIGRQQQKQRQYRLQNISSSNDGVQQQRQQQQKAPTYFCFFTFFHRWKTMVPSASGDLE